LDYTNIIKAELVKRGLKQCDMAKKLNMTVTTFNHKINRRGNKSFSIDEAILMCKELNVTLDEIFLIKGVA